VERLCDSIAWSRVLRLLHLSDIHLHDSSVEAQRLDLDAAVRRRLLVDLGGLVTRTGPCDAVLVVGDIGARGAPTDYDEAANFLTGVTELVGCEQDRIICVPGNHDIDRHSHTPTHDAIRRQLRTCKPNEINDLLVRLLNDPVAGAELLRPLDGYNEFALAFGCDISVGSPMWTPKTLPLGSRELVVHGITSAWIADEDDDDAEDDRRLVAGAFQCIPVGSDPQSITMTLCHHPLNWLRDAGEMTDWGSAAHLMLSGHEHSFGIELDHDQRWVRIASGAVNPSRLEDGWYPAYNIIELDDVAEGEDELHIRVYVRTWQPGARFGADIRFGDPHPVVLDLDRERPPTSPTTTVTPRPLNEIERTHGHRVMSSAPDRRRVLAKELGMPVDPEPGLDGDRAILKWAADTGNLSELTARLVGESIDG